MDDSKYLPFVSMVYVLAILAIWGLNLLSFRSMGFAGIAISLAATAVSFLALEYLMNAYGTSSYMVFTLLLAIAYFVSLSAFSFALSPAAMIATAFLLVPPLSVFVKSSFGEEKPPEEPAAAQAPPVPKQEEPPVSLDIY